MNENWERSFRIRPPRTARQIRNGSETWSVAFKRMLHFVRMTRRQKTSSTPKRVASKPYMQRCAIRVTYSPNRTPGQWAAHGRYLARESATHANSGQPSAFGPSGTVSDIHGILGNWQKAGDPRLFKLIISPEFGERVDLERLTRELLDKMEQDFGNRFEWVATAHHNTEHPHAHVTLRGVADNGEVRFPRSYIQERIRRHAEELVTTQLGYRSALETEEGRRREIQQMRFTSLDQILNRNNLTQGTTNCADHFVVDLGKGTTKSPTHYLKARLMFLEKLELAESNGSNKWTVRSDFQTVRRAIQQTSDRQRILASHGAVLSDSRLPLRVTDVAKLDQPLEGRVIAHGEEESTGRTYTILEGTDHHIHFIYRTPEMERYRHQRRLAPNSFVRLQKQFVHGRPAVVIVDYGDADKLLRNKLFLRNTVKSQIEHGRIPATHDLAGWLGKYETALAQTFEELQRQTMIGRGSQSSLGR
jgi:hypothetical protein